MTQNENLFELEWDYNEAYHRKGPMDGDGGTIKRIVFLLS